jgi:hypothetical protein
MVRLRLHKFDVTSIADGSVVNIIGRRATGKTTLVRDILHHKRDVRFGAVVSPTQSVDGLYSDIVPPSCIHDEYSPRILEQFLGSCATHAKSFMVLDACMSDPASWREPHLARLLTDGPALNCTVVIAEPYATGIPRDLRTSVDWVFVFRENLLGNRTRLYDSVCSVFPSFDIFCQTLDACTAEDHECLVIDNTSRSRRLEDRVMWYKAATEHQTAETAGMMTKASSSSVRHSARIPRRPSSP